MAVCITLFGCALMLAAPTFVPDHKEIGFFVAVLGILVALFTA